MSTQCRIVHPVLVMRDIEGKGHFKELFYGPALL